MAHRVTRHGLALLLILTFMLAACERPLQNPLLADLAPTEEAVMEGAEPEVEPLATSLPEVVTLPPEAMEVSPQPALPTVEAAEPAETEVPAEPEAAEEAAEAGVVAATEEAVEATAEGLADTESETTADASQDAEKPAAEEPAAEKPAAEEPAAEEPAAEEPSSEETGAADGGEPEATETAETEVPGPQTHVVAAGETLFRIGQRYGISWITLAEINHLANPNELEIGQVLIISAEPVAEPALAQATYVVQPGDTVFRISLRFGVDWHALAEENELEAPYVIYPGDELVIPGDP